MIIFIFLIFKTYFLICTKKIKRENDSYLDTCSSMNNIVIYKLDQSNLSFYINNYRNIDSVISAYKRYSYKILEKSKIKSKVLPKTIDILNNLKSNQNIQTSNHIYESIIFELHKILEEHKIEIFYSSIDTFTNQVFDKIFIELENNKIEIKNSFLKRKPGEINYLFEYPANAFKSDKDREIYIDTYIKNLSNEKSRKYLFICSYLSLIMKEILFIITSLCKNYGEVEMFLRSKNSKHLISKKIDEIQLSEKRFNKLDDFEKVKTTVLYRKLNLSFCENHNTFQKITYLGLNIEFKELQVYTNEILTMNLGNVFRIENEKIIKRNLQMFKIFIETNLITEMEGLGNRIAKVYILIEDHKIFEFFIDKIILFVINIAKDYSIEGMIKIIENIEFYKNENHKEYIELKTCILNQISIYRDYLVNIKPSYDVIIILESVDILYLLEKLKYLKKTSICPGETRDKHLNTTKENENTIIFRELCFALCKEIIETYLLDELKYKSGYRSGVVISTKKSQFKVQKKRLK